MGIPWSFKRNFTGAKEIKDTNDYLSKVGRAIGSLDSMPVGFNMPWWSDTLPSRKYMFMEGQSLADYPYARAVFGDNLPDLRGRVMVHKSADAEFNAIKKMGGEKSVTLTAAQSGLPAHTHPLQYDPAILVAAGGDYGDSGRTGINVDSAKQNIASDAKEAHTNLQPYIVCRFIAKVIP